MINSVDKIFAFYRKKKLFQSNKSNKTIQKVKSIYFKISKLHFEQDINKITSEKKWLLKKTDCNSSRN